MTSVLTFIYSLHKDKIEAIKAIITNGTAAIKTVVTNLKNDITNTIKELVNNALQWGRDMMDNLLKGITEKAQAVIDKVKSVAGEIAAFLHFTEPDKGPLKNFNDWPRHMMEQYAEGIEAGRYLVKNAVSDVTADVAMMNPDSLSADEIYSAINAGASDANISIVIGDRELGRALRGMGVVMA